MNTAPAAPSVSLMRPLAASLLHDKHRIALTAAVILLAALATALVIRPLYEADSTLLVLLGSEYTYRPVAGENISVTEALDREQILRTEIEILESDDLHRQVIRAMTVERLYPALLQPPGVLASARMAVRSFVDGLRESAGVPVPPRQPEDPVEQALLLFDDHLSAEAVKAGNAIDLSFAHRDPKVAAEVLNRLEAAYLARRRSLYMSHESDIVAHQADAVRARLEAADASLARFKAEKNIADYPARRAILLNQQGALETDLSAASNDAAQQEARLAQLADQERKLPRTVTQSRDAEVDQRLTPLRASVEALRAREQEQRVRYRPNSDVVANTHQQLMALESALTAQRGDQAPGSFRVGQNPVFLQVEMDTAKAQVELQGARARAAQDEAQLVRIGASLSVLNEDEQRLTELERARAVLEEDYRSAAKVRDEHRVTETVQADRQSNVRVLQAAVIPELPRATRKLILAAGAVLSLVGAAGMALASHFLRRVYLVPESLEADTGLRVLCSVPNSRRRAAAGLAVRPS